MPPPPKKSRVGLWIGLGCGCVVVLIAIVAIAGYLGYRAIGGTEVASADLQPGQPFTLSYTQDGTDQHEVWMELDVSYSTGLSLSGPINISVPNRQPGQYNLQLTGDGSPIRERSSSRTVNWVSTDLGGSGSTSGKTLLFPLPAYESGATVTISGTVTASPGLAARRLRIFVTD